MSTTEEILNETFKKVGNDFGYETSAEYAAFRDLKVRWQRSYKWADFQVSDYLRDAPEEVLFVVGAEPEPVLPCLVEVDLPLGVLELLVVLGGPV